MIENKEKNKIEKEFISLLLKNKDLVGDWIESQLKIEHFDKQHYHILTAILIAFNNDVLLTRKTFLDYIDNFINSKNESQLQEFVYNSINSLPSNRNDFPNLLNKILDLHIKKSAINFIQEFSNNLEKGDPKLSVKKLTEKLSDLSSDSIQKNAITYESVNDFSNIYINDLKKKRTEGEDNSKQIKCHIKEIDDAMSIGFDAGTLTLFCSDVGGFKTSMMLNIGMNIWELSKKNVLFVPLEMPKKLMYQKFLSRKLKIDSNKLAKPHLLSEEEYKLIEQSKKIIDETSEKCGSKFYIMEAPEQVPVSVIKREIEKHIEIFKPQLVVIDYIANLIPDQYTKKERDDLQTGAMLKYLRTMGKPGSVTEEGFAIVSGAQIGREALKRVRRSAANKASFHSEDLRGSHELSADADNIFAQMEDPQQLGHRLWVFCVKSRYGNKTFSNGTNRAVLEIKPQFSLIQSMNDIFHNVSHEDVMKKINNAETLNFDDNDLDGPIKEQNSKINDAELDKILGL